MKNRQETDQRNFLNKSNLKRRFPALYSHFALSIAMIGLAGSVREMLPIDPASCGCDALETQTQSPSTAGLASSQSVSPPKDPNELTGAIAFVHDPVIAKERRIYHVFSTGMGLAERTSPDRVNWLPPTRVLDPTPAWIAPTIPGNRGSLWAPDISRFNGKWHLYYAVSSFGRNRSAIGQATNETLDSKDKRFKWVDQGPAFQSYPKDEFNAIDPNIAFDEHGRPWLSFGSFWGGIKILPLDPTTGNPLNPAEVPIGIATRGRGPGNPNAIEAPFIIRRGRFFYLFVSFDFCCRGVRSTYNVRVGRSRSIIGPYLDADGKSMMQGGGSPVVQSAGKWHGPGHNAFIHDGRRDFLVYHAYDGEQNGVPKMRIQPVVWTKQGWPTVPTGP